MAQNKKQMANLRKSTPSEARINGRKGGIASARKRRLMKNTRECFNAIKDLPLPSNMNEMVNKFFGTEDEEYTFAILNLFNLFQAGRDGNANAMKQITEIDGSLEREKVDDVPQANVYIVSSIESAKQFANAEKHGMPQSPSYDDDDDE